MIVTLAYEEVIEAVTHWLYQKGFSIDADTVEVYATDQNGEQMDDNEYGAVNASAQVQMEDKKE